MFLYFIRVKDQFVRTFEEKLKDVLGVMRIEQVSVLGHPAKCERDFRLSIREHTMLIVRVQYEKSVAEVEKMLEAGNLLGAIYQYEKCKLAD